MFRLVAYQFLVLQRESKTALLNGLDGPKSASAEPLIHVESLQFAIKSRFSSSCCQALEVQATQSSCLGKRHLSLPYVARFKKDQAFFGLGHLH